MIADVRPAGWHSGPDCHWESWSRNGEVCIVGLDPPFTGGARLASGLTWLLRSFASHSRQVHDATPEHRGKEYNSSRARRWGDVGVRVR